MAKRGCEEEMRARAGERGGGGGGDRWIKMRGREAGCCNENEITGAAGCQDGDKVRCTQAYGERR